MFLGTCIRAQDDHDDDQPNSPPSHHHSLDDDREDHHFSSVIRRVRSLDFGSLPRTSSASCSSFSCDDATPSCGAASRFSHDASCHRRVHPQSRRLSGSKSACFSPLLPSHSEETEDFKEPGQERVDRKVQGVMRLFTGPRWTVGYASVLMLALLTLSNFALEIVHAQIHRIDAPQYYDALSMDVLSPPMKYTTSVLGTRRPLGLGTAAISSVTTALSPILPFTGGVDLRREEHWDTEGGWFNTVSSMVDQVRDAFGMEPLMLSSSGAALMAKIPRGGGRASNNINEVRVKLTAGGASISSKRRKTEHELSLSAPKPFIPIDTISKMTLSDLTTFFQYAIENNRAGFQRGKFVNRASERVKPLLSLLDSAVSKSRGKDVEPARTGECGDKCYGDIDALQFCSAMRLFAEWRLVRQVPEGYKGFAVGMNLGHKDVVQNVAKIEQAAHDWIDHRRELIELQNAWENGQACAGNSPSLNDDCELRSPTLRDLLEHEIDMEVHPSLPRLKDKTAAMGLLWVRRQLHYQTSLFANILKVPRKFPTTNAAVSAAYSEVYGRYHGWAVQKIFNYSFQAAPEVEHIYRFMNPHRLQDAMQKARKMASKTTTNPKQADAATEDGDITLPQMNPMERLLDSVARLFNKGDAKVSTSQLDIRGGGSEDDEHDLYVAQVMAQDAHEHIVIYLEKVEPLLKDLAGLFDDLNMDDPTKV